MKKRLSVKVRFGSEEDSEEPYQSATKLASDREVIS
jgi:hypothetical protein